MPQNREQIRGEILKRAGYQCEWIDELPSQYPYSVRCIEEHGKKALWFKGMVVLTIAHLCHKTKCARRNHLRALCQRHHLKFDAALHAKNRKKNLTLK